jgi:glycosyltransferase involved in cell wall biosynthesis
MAVGALALARAARAVDVVYATGLYHRAALMAARTPLVIKLVNDPAYERAKGRGWFLGSLEEFQGARGDVRIAGLRRARDVSLRRASVIVVPSRYLADIVSRWSLGQTRIEVIPNPAVVAHTGRSRQELRAGFGMTGTAAVFAGRFVEQKNLRLALDAMRSVDDLTLYLVGDGPERESVTRTIGEWNLEDRVRLIPAVAQPEAGDWMRAADVTVLPSSWENFPHAAVESLAHGTPVIATSVGGVPEIVDHDRSGWLVPPGDAAAMAAALTRFTTDAEARRRLRDGAAASSDRFDPQTLFASAEALLAAAARR